MLEEKKYSSSTFSFYDGDVCRDNMLVVNFITIIVVCKITEKKKKEENRYETREDVRDYDITIASVVNMKRKNKPTRLYR